MRIFETLWFLVVLAACGASQNQPREEPPPDADEDGIADGVDGCPDRTEDFDGDADDDSWQILGGQQRVLALSSLFIGEPDANDEGVARRFFLNLSESSFSSSMRHVSVYHLG